MSTSSQSSPPTKNTLPTHTPKLKRKCSEQHPDENVRSNSDKRKKTKKLLAVEQRESEPKDNFNPEIAKLDRPLLADYVARKTRQHSSHLSSVEFKDLHISGI